MSVTGRFLAAACAAVALVSSAVVANGARPGEWLTWGADVERTGWNRHERHLSRSSVRRLALKWKAQIEQEIPVTIESGASMLTAPLVAKDVRTPSGTRTLVYTQAATNTLAALDASSGEVVWRVTFENTVPPANPANWLCTNTATATPVIDKAKNILYTIAADGRLHGVDLASGAAKMTPTQVVPPYSRNWSLNLVDGVLYTTVGRGCGNAPPDAQPPPPPPTSSPAVEAAAEGGGRLRRPQVASHMVAIDLEHAEKPITRLFTSPSRPSGAWSRGGLISAFDSFFVLTADGPWDPQKALWGQSLLRLKPRTLEVLDYFTPSNLDALNKDDLDYGSGGVVAFAHRNRRFLVSAGKDGTVYLHDAQSLGGADHRTPLHAIKAGNDQMFYTSMGVWGQPATALDRGGERWVYVPMQGPPSEKVTFRHTNGAAPDGSIMAFQLALDGATATLVPRWVSRNLAVPESPVIANGVVYALSTGENTLQRRTDPRYPLLYQVPGEPRVPRIGVLTSAERSQMTTHATLYALDAETGAELYSSGETIDDWTHLSSVTVADGTVYVTTRKTRLYAFGVRR